MSLLADPEKHEVLSKNLPKYAAPLSALSFLAGVIWLLFLVSENFNQRTYFSENALLPGLVEPEFSSMEESFAKEQFRLLKEKKFDTFGHASEAFRDLGLEVYDHHYNFTAPFFSAATKEFKTEVKQGRNLYSILRAPRAASLESIVFSVSIRSSSSSEKSVSNSGGIAIMLSLADLFRHKIYWAKDIVFLITDDDLWGSRAWLEAYHAVSSADISSEPLSQRAGAIQAAINLEIPSADVNAIDLKIVGINGQMPNLDLVNLIKLLFQRENIPLTIHNSSKLLDTNLRNPVGIYLRDLETASKMVLISAAGHYEGSHGAFLQYGIQAVTVRAMKNSKLKGKISFHKFGVVLEGVTRSLNNLLERFHQSFFFYIVTSTSRFMSIGLYMMPYGLLLLPIALTALSSWLQSCAPTEASPAKSSHAVDASSLKDVLPFLLISHAVGIFSFLSLKMGQMMGFSSVEGVDLANLAVFLIPVTLWSNSPGKRNLQLLKSVSLIEMTIGLYAVSMLNFPLALVITLLVTPVYCWVPDRSKSVLSAIHGTMLIATHPLFLKSALLLLHRFMENSGFLNGNIVDVLLEESRRSLLEFSYYGNWFLPVFHLFLTPLWCVQMIVFRLSA